MPDRRAEQTRETGGESAGCSVATGLAAQGSASPRSRPGLPLPAEPSCSHQTCWAHNTPDLLGGLLERLVIPFMIVFNLEKKKKSLESFLEITCSIENKARVIGVTLSHGEGGGGTGTLRGGPRRPSAWGFARKTLSS